MAPDGVPPPARPGFLRMFVVLTTWIRRKLGRAGRRVRHGAFAGVDRRERHLPVRCISCFSVLVVDRVVAGEPAELRRFAKAGREMSQALAGAGVRLECTLGVVRSRCDSSLLPPAVLSGEVAGALRRHAGEWSAIDADVGRVAGALEEADRRRIFEETNEVGNYHVRLAPVGGGITSAEQATAKFNAHIENLYRNEAQVGDGSTAAALEREAALRIRIGSRAGHYEKAQTELRGLRKLDGNPHLTDEQAAQLSEEIAKLERAINAAEEATGLRGARLTRAMKEWHYVEPRAAARPDGVVEFLGAALETAGNLLFSPVMVLLPTGELPRSRRRDARA
ncbi:MAG TPA: hypothetical protein VHN98_09920 [Acidimicrobiales bacterium]|nr:hypothetical protein [Acidimicrobiales bacterium]